MNRVLPDSTVSRFKRDLPALASNLLIVILKLIKFGTQGFKCLLNRVTNFVCGKSLNLSSAPEKNLSNNCIRSVLCDLKFF